MPATVLFQAVWRNAPSPNLMDGHCPVPERSSYGEASADASLAASRDTHRRGGCPVEYRVIARCARTGETLGAETVARVYPQER